MKLTPYQIIVPLAAFIAVAYAWNLTFKKKKTLWEAGLWTVFWGIIGFIAVYPNALTYLSAATGIENQENAFVVTLLGILFFIVFYLIIRLEELEGRHAEMVRAVALAEVGLQKGTDATKATGAKGKTAQG
jgi:hypothetical protein